MTSPVLRCKYCQHDFGSLHELAGHQEACGRHACHGGDVIIKTCDWCKDRLYAEITGRVVDSNYEAWLAEWMATTNLYAKDRMVSFIYEGAGNPESIWASILPPEPAPVPVRSRQGSGVMALIGAASVNAGVVANEMIFHHTLPVANVIMFVLLVFLALWSKRTFRLRH